MQAAARWRTRRISWRANPKGVSAAVIAAAVTRRVGTRRAGAMVGERSGDRGGAGVGGATGGYRAGAGGGGGSVADIAAAVCRRAVAHAADIVVAREVGRRARRSRGVGRSAVSEADFAAVRAVALVALVARGGYRGSAGGAGGERSGYRGGAGVALVARAAVRARWRRAQRISRRRRWSTWSISWQRRPEAARAADSAAALDATRWPGAGGAVVTSAEVRRPIEIVGTASARARRTSTRGAGRGRRRRAAVFARLAAAALRASEIAPSRRPRAALAALRCLRARGR